VKQALANDGPRMKRIRPAPMGRAYRYQRRLTHIVLSVAERAGGEGLVTRAEEPVAAKAVAGKSKPVAGKKSVAKKVAAKKPVATIKKKASKKA
jgi:large subunit ribosomal protein L22